MKAHYFRFHDFESMKFCRPRRPLAAMMDSVETKFAYFNHHRADDSLPGLMVELGPFVRQRQDGEVVVNGRYFVGRDRIFFTGRHKIGSWSVEADRLTQAATVLRIHTNLPGVLMETELIEAFLRFRFNRAGYPVVHACAFEWQGSGVLLAGGGGIGKTTTAIKLLESTTARLLGDNWIPIHDGVAYPFPTSFNLWDYNMSPLIWAHFTLGEKLRYLTRLALGKLTRGYARVFTPFSVALHFPERIADPTPVRLVCMLLPGAEFAVEPADPQTVIQRLVAINQLDSPTFLQATLAYRCADPGHPFATHWETLTQNLTRHLPEGVPCYTVRIPRRYGTDTFHHLMEFVDRHVTGV